MRPSALAQRPTFRLGMPGLEMFGQRLGDSADGRATRTPGSIHPNQPLNRFSTLQIFGPGYRTRIIPR